MKLIPYVKRPEFLFNLKENSEQVNYFKRCIYVLRVMFAGKHKTDLILKKLQCYFSSDGNRFFFAYQIDKYERELPRIR